MKADIIFWSIMGLLASGTWVAIIWAIGKYDPSPWWGFLCFPIVTLVALSRRINLPDVEGESRGQK